MGRVKREGQYVEDSTKGMAMMIPRNYKGDVNCQVWLDSRLLATMSIWLDDQGVWTRFMSEVLRESIRTICEYLVDTEQAVMVEDTVEARELLERKYKVNLNPDGRGRRNTINNIKVSEYRAKLADYAGRKRS